MGRNGWKWGHAAPSDEADDSAISSERGLFKWHVFVTVRGPVKQRQHASAHPPSGGVHMITSRSQISHLHSSGWLSSTILIHQALGSIALRLSQSQIQHPHCQALICYSYLCCQHGSLFLTRQKRSLPCRQQPMIHHLSGPWLCEVSLRFLTAWGVFQSILRDGNLRWSPADGNRGDFFIGKKLPKRHVFLVLMVQRRISWPSVCAFGC